MAAETRSPETEPEPAAASGAKGAAASAGAFLARAWRSARGGARRLFASFRPWIVALSVIILLNIFWTPIKNLYWRFLPPTGAIYVDSPEVYTRERLINERLSEEAWLDDQLEAAATNEDFTSVENVIRRQLSLDLDQGEPSGPVGAGGAEADTDGPSLIGFNDKFRLRSASRSLIRQRIIENKLDDRHDLEGNALYVLKFDSTVISAPASGRMAQVKVEILPPHGIDDAAVHADGEDLTDEFLRQIRGRAGYRFESIYDMWQESIDDRINNRIRVLYSRFLLEPLDQKETTNIQNFAELSSGGPGPLALRLARREPLETMESLLDSVPEEERESYARRIKAYFARKAVAEVLGMAEDEIEIDLSSDYDPFHEYPINSRSVPDALGLTVRITNESAAPPRVHVGPRFIQLYVFDVECQVNPVVTDSQTIMFAGEVHRENEETSKLNFFRLVRLDSPIEDESHDLETIVSNAVIQFLNQERTSDAGWNMFQIPVEYKNNIPFFKVSEDCTEMYTLALNAGYYNFVRSVVDYNTYSYSVLPREGALPVVSDISSRYEYGSPGGLFDGVLGVGTRGAELRSYLTTFGDVAHRSADTRPLPTDDSQGSTSRSEHFSPIVGWIIDPGAKAPAARATGSFVTVNESILAIISVPAWWTEVRLALKKEWIEGSGTVIPAESANSDSIDGRRELTVRLPNRPELIDSLLVDSARSGPVISEIDATAIQTCDETPVLIIGQRLWRNTAVTVGSVKAQRVEVMPNMGGVVAYFRNPFSASRDERLRLWTSEGMTEVKLTTPIRAADSERCEQPAAQ
ncbi:MAG: hypothetical protein GY798_00115 [Hyphomicrobiales bacterium]|nr:hypothetical protein [Hyphomicrobiales bacterium]